MSLYWLDDIDAENADVVFGRFDKQMNVRQLALYLSILKRDVDRMRQVADEVHHLKFKLKNMADELDHYKIADCNELSRFMYREYEYLMAALLDDAENDENLKDIARPCYVYYILNFEKDKVKIGISYNPISRAKQIQTSSGEEIEILHTIQFHDRQEALDAEQFLHDYFRFARKTPSKVAKSCEWFEAEVTPILLRRFDTREKIITSKNNKEMWLGVHDHEAQDMFQLMYSSYGHSVINIYLAYSLQRSPGSNTSLKDLYSNYKEWCGFYNQIPDNRANFFKTVRHHNYYANSGTINGKTVRNVVKNLAIRPIKEEAA